MITQCKNQQTVPMLQAQEKQRSALKVFDDQLLIKKKEFESVLPAGCAFDRFMRIVKTGIIQNNELLAADRTTLFTACFRAAQDGLLPDGREAALVVYNTKDNKTGTYKKAVQYMPMIAGILKKIRNSGEILSLCAHVVYENDLFDYELGDNEFIKHKPCLDERGKPTRVYAIAKTKDGAIHREVMNVAEIEKIRACSKSANGQAWNNHWGEMGKKVVVRRLSKMLPMNSDVEQVIRADDEKFEFSNIDSKSTGSAAVDFINRRKAKETYEGARTLELRREEMSEKQKEGTDNHYASGKIIEQATQVINKSESVDVVSGAKEKPAVEVVDFEELPIV